MCFHFLHFCLLVWSHLSDYPDVSHLCLVLFHLHLIVSHPPIGWNGPIYTPPAPPRPTQAVWPLLVAVCSRNLRSELC